ncbi:hypothetical protein EBR96_09930, partial [bacterium]|nr:hypothetical protein [bacterium]
MHNRFIMHRSAAFTKSIGVIGFCLGLISSIFAASQLSTVIEIPASRNWDTYTKGSVIVTGNVRLSSDYLAYRPDQVMATVQCKVDQLPNRHFRYRYTITNTSSHSIAAISLEQSAESTSLSPSPTFQILDGRYAWQYSDTFELRKVHFPVILNGREGSVPLNEYGLPPGQTTVLEAESVFPPAMGQMGIRGTGWVYSIKENNLLTAPVNCLVVGPSLIPGSIIPRMSIVGLANYIVLSKAAAVNNGWLVESGTIQKIDGLMSQIKESISSPNHRDIVGSVIKEINRMRESDLEGDLKGEYADFLSLVLPYYLARID